MRWKPVFKDGQWVVELVNEIQVRPTSGTNSFNTIEIVTIAEEEQVEVNHGGRVLEL
jgi:hypothetical protein